MARKRTSSSQLGKLEGGDKYNFNRMTYPSTGLASDAIPNYVVFYINVPQGAGYNKTSSRVDPNSSVDLSNSAKIRDRIRTPEQLTTGVGANRSTVDLATGLIAFSAAEGGGIGSVAQQTGIGLAVSELYSDVTKRPKLNRIKTAIALYMPDTVFQTYGHDYDGVSATDALGKLGFAQRGGSAITNAIQAGYGAFNKGSYEGLVGGDFSGDNITKAATNLAGVASAAGGAFKGNPGGMEIMGRLAEATGVVGPGFADLTLRAQGLALNPQIEMIYKQTRNRSFVFDFKLQPRSSKESRNIKNIIREFKRYAAPSVNRTNSFYFTIPAQFDIQFMFYKDGTNEENRFIGKISTCVLENIDVNYSSAGPFAVFEDGSPVEIGLQLRFVEVDILTKEAFEDGNGEINIERDDGASF